MIAPALNQPFSGREFPFTPKDFQRVRTLLYQHAGISLSDAKDQLVYSRLARRLRATGQASFQAYLDALQVDSPEWQQFLNALTTNLTAFFREAHHFDFLAQQIAARPSGELRIWCTASSTGEEPYSIAMTVLEALGSRASRVQIVASDIDTHVLEKAEQGVYPLDRVEKLESVRLSRFFQRGVGRNTGFVRVRPEVRRLIEFRQINLLEARWPVEPGCDAIFCRNVMIYFDKSTQKTIAERFVPLLKPGGWLFMGHSENLAAVTNAFELIGKTIYRHASATRHRG